MLKIPDGEGSLFSQMPDAAQDGSAGTRDYSSEIDRLADDMKKTEDAINDNIFASASDRQAVKDYVALFYREMAFTRQDINKIYD